MTEGILEDYGFYRDDPRRCDSWRDFFVMKDDGRPREETLLGCSLDSVLYDYEEDTATQIDEEDTAT